MKRPFVKMAAILGILMLTGTSSVIAGEEVLTKGAFFPSVKLAVPDDAAHKKYLGLSGSGTFDIPDIAAHVVIVEIFSMYCPHCQKEAPAVNELYRIIENNPMARGKVKLIGIGAGNSPFEVDYFRETYAVPFPLFPDKDYAIHDRIGGVRTPFFYGVAITKGKPAEIFFTYEGKFETADSFLELILKESGLK